MYKQSSGRNNRSKGFKIKHAIQLLVLVAICIWLIYQVKHSHDKKREFDEKNIKTTSSLSNGAGDEVIKFGRKDVQARYEKMTLVTDGKVEEAEDEEAEGGGGGQEDNKNEEDEQEEDIKHEEKEEEVRRGGGGGEGGGGDDEIDENDQHKYDMELEHEENLIDEKDAEGDEKDAEGKDTEEEVEEEEERPERENLEEGERSEGENSEEGEKSEKENSEEGERERENSGEGQREREEEDHEAREEHYKADDASSAVAHETESESLEKLNENSGTEEKSSNIAEEFSAQGNQTVGNDIHQNVFTAKERSSLNSTMKVEEKSSGLEEGNDSIEMSRENSDALSNQIQEDVGLISGDGKKSDLKATNNFTTQLLEEEQKPQETSQNIVHESTSEVNTTTGAELDHSEVVESGKEDPNADSILSDPIDSLDSSSSNLQESSAALHDHVGVDNNIRRTMEGNSDEQDATANM